MVLGVLVMFLHVDISEAKGHGFTLCNLKNTWWAQSDEAKQ